MRIEHLHAGDLHNYNSCNRRFFWSKIKRIVKIGQTTEEFYTEGSVGHEFIRALYDPSYEPVMPAEATPEIITKMDSLVSLYYSYYASQGEFDRYEMISQEFETPFNLAKVDPSLGDFVLVYTLDMKVLDKKTGGISIFDHKFYKTKKSDNQVYCMGQPFYYPWFIEQMGFKYEFFVLNQIIKKWFKAPSVLKSGRLSTAKTTLEETTYKLFVDMVDELGQSEADYGDIIPQLKADDAGKVSSLFHRTYVPKSPGREKIEAEGILKAAKSIVHAGTDRENYPMNFGYSCSGCPFFVLCSTEIEGGDVQRELEWNFENKSEDER